jgi:hypothetical protein
MNYQPKGGMCLTCKNKLKVKECSSLKFSEMPKLKTFSDSTVIVKCTSFESAKP